MASTESEIGALLNARSDAIRTRDIDRLMSLFSPDVIYFDVVPPLRYAGSAALRARLLDWFNRWKTSIGQELRHVSIVAAGELAAAHMLIRTSGTLKDGREVGYWVRASDFCRRSDQRWSITHEHVSIPVDLVRGQPALDLVP